MAVEGQFSSFFPFYLYFKLAFIIFQNTGILDGSLLPVTPYRKVFECLVGKKERSFAMRKKGLDGSNVKATLIDNDGLFFDFSTSGDFRVDLDKMDHKHHLI